MAETVREGAWPGGGQAGGGQGGGAADVEPIAEATEIPYHEWPGFFDSFSERHAGEPVRVEIGTARPGWPIDSVTRRLAVKPRLKVTHYTA